jgi:hypothetical protein
MLPIITDSHHAATLARQQNDRFYLAAYSLQTWISELSIRAIADYVDNPDPGGRSMQAGQAAQGFVHCLGRVRDQHFHHAFNSFVRFAHCDNPLSLTLLQALAPVYIEHECTGDFLRPGGPSPLTSPDPQLLRRTVQRACDWLDAVIHLQTHSLWFKEPACFAPDPEVRRLAASALSQQFAAQMNDPAVVSHFTANTTPRPPTPERPWPFPKFDERVIFLWPILRHYSWSFGDLWTVLQEHDSQPCPCESAAQLEDYCSSNLGLRIPIKDDQSRANPLGFQVARRFLARGGAKSPVIGSAPWS